MGHVDPRVTRANDAKPRALARSSTGSNVVAGTAWLLARAEMERNASTSCSSTRPGSTRWRTSIAVGHLRATRSSSSATRTSCRGDPGRPSADGVEVSALGHLLGDDATIRPRRGLFLDETRRLHPASTPTSSDAFYEGRLEAIRAQLADRADQTRRRDPLTGCGRAMAARRAHAATARTQRRRPRSSRMPSTTARRQAGSGRRTRRSTILGLEDRDRRDAVQRPRGARSRGPSRPLGTTGNVGTVDKFQGQEGAVAIYSMASSSREDAPRDMGFLYSRNRLNVAASRAESIAIVVASPELARAGCRTPSRCDSSTRSAAIVEVAAAESGRGRKARRRRNRCRHPRDGARTPAQLAARRRRAGPSRAAPSRR